MPNVLPKQCARCWLSAHALTASVRRLQRAVSIIARTLDANAGGPDDSSSSESYSEESGDSGGSEDGGSENGA